MSGCSRSRTKQESYVGRSRTCCVFDSGTGIVGPPAYGEAPLGNDVKGSRNANSEIGSSAAVLDRPTHAGQG